MFLEDGRPVGVYAREQGALVPTRLVHSAKSWLSNPDVDRTAKILPWDSQETGRVLSPVEVSSDFLRKFREAWDQKHGAPLAEQDIVLTVPASFDEEARELTVMAASEAGLPKLTLLEEPAAAFYSWIANNFARSSKLLYDGQIVLVCDVGGGTSDFSLIRVSREGDRIDFTRTAVGKHLLLGGDNLDLTLAWLVETKLGKPLSLRQRSGLRRQCTAAKERLLSEPNLKSVEITVLGAGASLVGGALKTEILREEALELLLEGFLPMSQRGDPPKDEKRSLFRELGLPYVTDPAITKHLNVFLEGASSAARRHPLQRRFLHPRNRPRPRGRCRRPLVWQAARDSRESRSRSRGCRRRRILFLRSFHRQRCAGSRRFAARLLSRDRPARGRQNRPLSAWSRAAPKKARRSKLIATTCN